MKYLFNKLKVISWNSARKNDCGPRCLRLISLFYGKSYDLQYLYDLSSTNIKGSSLYGLSSAATEIGFINVPTKVSIEDISNSLLPCIIYINENHFVVLNTLNRDNVFISDPALGDLVLSTADFLEKWIIRDSNPRKGYALFLKPNHTW